MSKNTITGILLAVAVLLIGTYTYYNFTLPPLEQSSTEPAVAATIFPLYDIARHVAGEAVPVELLLPPGASPHTFEPAPSTLKKLQNADALYAIGHKSDNWVTGLISGSNTELIVVDDGINLRSLVDHDDEHEQGEVDPHYWLSVPNAKLIAATIAADLTQRYPDLADQFAQNLAAYETELAATDTQIRQILAPIENKEMVTLHDAWYYFAEEYGLNITATFEPTPGREPTPQYLAALGWAVHDINAQAIYSEPQLVTDTLEPFVADHNLIIAVLDPLGGLENRDSYTATMIYNAETIAQNQ